MKKSLMKIKRFLQKFFGNCEGITIVSIEKIKENEFLILYKDKICRIIYKEKVNSIDDFLKNNNLSNKSLEGVSIISRAV